MLIDTHIHLDADDFREDLDTVIDKAVSQGIETMLVPNVDSGTSARVIELCAHFPAHCHPMMGLHPTSVRENYLDELKQVETWLGKQPFTAIGEIGIDLYWDKTWVREQEIAFVQQMHWARELKLPAVIHSRKSLEEIIQLIRKEDLSDIPAVFHCFPGNRQQAERLTGMGYKLGIGGVVTFKNAEMAEVVRSLPLECLVLETDAPWLAPVPFRGKRNEPANIRLIAEKIAELKETSVEEVAAKTSQAARSLFILPVS